MPDYFVSIDINGDKREGYILAKNRDVALSRFMSTEGIAEICDDDWAVVKVYHIRMDRLSSYIDEPDPWGVGFKREMIDQDDGSIAADFPNSILNPAFNDPAVISCMERWHAARIVYLMQHIDQMLTPICIDNQCHAGRIYPIPEILDGWHRYYAHLHLGFGRIRCTYGGLVDLLDYLEGKTDDQPEF